MSVVIRRPAYQIGSALMAAARRDIHRAGLVLRKRRPGRQRDHVLKAVFELKEAAALFAAGHRIARGDRYGVVAEVRLVADRASLEVAQ